MKLGSLKADSLITDQKMLTLGGNTLEVWQLCRTQKVNSNNSNFAYENDAHATLC